MLIPESKLTFQNVAQTKTGSEAVNMFMDFFSLKHMSFLNPLSASIGLTLNSITVNFHSYTSNDIKLWADKYAFSVIASH